VCLAGGTERINLIGYRLIAARFSRTIKAPDSVLAPALYGLRPLDRALIEITASPEWRRVEQCYFGQ
jgi:hypothetical protein